MHITHSIWSGTYSSRTLRALVLSAAGALTVACDSGSGSDSVDSLGSDGGRRDGGSDTGSDGGTAEDGGDTDAGELPSACPELETKTLTSDDAIIAADTRWEAAIYEVPTGISISGGTLTIDPCAVIKMPGGATMTVRDGGAIKAVGTATLPIRFTSAKASAAPGDWNGIELYQGSSNDNEIAYAIVEYAGSDTYGAIWVDGGATVTIHHSTVQSSDGVGVYADNGASLPGFTANTLRDNGKGAVHVGANGVDQLGEGTYTPNGVDAIVVYQENIDHDATWLAHDAPYVAEGGFTASAESGSALVVLAAGVTLKVGPSSNISIRNNAGLELAGTAAEPVTITSSKPAPEAGDWGEIDIYQGSADAHNKFTYAVLEYGGNASIYGMVWVDGGASLSATHTTFRNSGSFGVFADLEATFGAFTDNTLTGNANGPVRVGANTVNQLGAGTYTPNDVEAITVQTEVIDHDSTWLALGVPYVAENGFTVGGSGAGSARLTLEAGTTLKVGSTIAVRDQGGLTLAGTAAAHVTVTCANASCAAGDWNEIDLYGSSVDAYNSFTYADIMYGGESNLYGQLWLDSGAGLTLNNTTFSNGRLCDIYVRDNTSTLNATASTYNLCTR
jgi:hypothetical protein